MKNRNAVNWFEIFVDNMDRAQKFYEQVLGVKMQEYPMPDPSTDRMVMFEWVDNAPNACGALVWNAKMKAGGNSTIVYFECEDCAVEQSRVEAAGGKVLYPKMAIGENGFCATCIDTEGNWFGLQSMQ